MYPIAIGFLCLCIHEEITSWLHQQRNQKTFKAYCAFLRTVSCLVRLSSVATMRFFMEGRISCPASCFWNKSTFENEMNEIQKGRIDFEYRQLWDELKGFIDEGRWFSGASANLSRASIFPHPGGCPRCRRGSIHNHCTALNISRAFGISPSRFRSIRHWGRQSHFAT